jgi:diaminohydroxyphosphoribosylaminopyrimidine deaminase/5-amino-6-(5-phosphoribosylamino)uracil reductase
VETVPATDQNGRPDLAAILRRLGQLEMTSLMIEGGSTVNGMALASNIVDKIFLYYAPKILGTGSIPLAAGAGVHAMSQIVKVKHVHLHRFGEDFAVEGYLRNPYGE